jgi:signal transduction histidine kinase
MASSRRSLWVVAGGVTFTAAVLLLPAFPLAVRDPLLHVAVEMSAAWISLTAPLLILGRVRRRRRVTDVLLLASFTQTGFANLLLSAAPAIWGGEAADAVAVWGAVAGRTTAALCFAVAAFAGTREIDGRPWIRWVVATSLSLTVTIGAVVGATADRLPQGVGQVIDPVVNDTGLVPDILVHPVVAATQLVMLAAYMAGAIAFARRADADADPLLRWLPGAGALAAFARLHYFLLPSLYSDVVYSGDLLRIGFYALLLTAALAELRATWRAVADTITAEERRRIARNLHDGLAQELSFITTQSAWLAKRYPDEVRTELLVSSAGRALDESRRAIRTLNNRTPARLSGALAAATEDVAARHGREIHFDVDPSIDVPADVCEELVRIACEAVGNAARHADPEHILLRLGRRGAQLSMEIVDDGRGFDVAGQGGVSTRFGLQTMHQRAEGLGGALQVESTSCDGTTVRVLVPWPS